MIAIYLREIIFGFEDSLVSTLGTITGVAVGSGNSDFVILTGSVLVAVEAISMAAGSYLSSKTEEEVEATHRHSRRNESREHPLIAGVIMFFSYLAGGFFPLLPYLFLSVQDALWLSVILTFIFLFVLGAWKTRFTKRSWWKSGSEMVVVCAFAAIIGYWIGRLLA
ncbi:MAG: VIT1/CCC1 transporter family protein [Patescibacteria group bacterium]